MASPHRQLSRVGIVVALFGFVLASLALVGRSGGAEATTHSFEGNCVSLTSAGVCVLDEPEGRNPAVHGLVSYLRTPTTMTFTLAATDPVTEVQICMQTNQAFPEGANVCAGSHGAHVPYTRLGATYTVDLVAAHLASAPTLYWTLHVVAGGRTLQVIGKTSLDPATTTTTKPTTTTTTKPTTSTTTNPSTTGVSTSTTATTTPPTSATSPTSPTSTTTTLVAPTSAPTTPASTTTSLAVQVLPESLARTGGPHWWALLLGAALMLIGVTTAVVARALDNSGSVTR